MDLGIDVRGVYFAFGVLVFVLFITFAEKFIKGWVRPRFLERLHSSATTFRVGFLFTNALCEAAAVDEKSKNRVTERTARVAKNALKKFEKAAKAAECTLAVVTCACGGPLAAEVAKTGKNHKIPVHLYVDKQTDGAGAGDDIPYDEKCVSGKQPHDENAGALRDLDVLCVLDYAPDDSEETGSRPGSEDSLISESFRKFSSVKMIFNLANSSDKELLKPKTFNVEQTTFSKED